MAPVFYFHGIPSCRLDCKMFSSPALLDDLGIRLIAVDSPGCEGSAYQRGRRLSDWPQDVAVLADFLGVNEFAVLGWSGGGPYALACAQLMPTRVSTTIVVSSVASYVIPGLAEGAND